MGEFGVGSVNNGRRLLDMFRDASMLVRNMYFKYKCWH